MRKIISLLRGTLVLAFVLSAVQAFAAEPLVLKTDQDRQDYTTGVYIVRQLQQWGTSINLDIVIQGLKAGTGSGTLLLSEDIIRKITAEIIDTDSAKGHQAAAQGRGEERAVDNSGMSQPAPAGTDAASSQRENGSPDQQIVQSSRLPSSGGTDSMNSESSSGPPVLPQQDAGADTPVGLGGRLMSDGSLLSKHNQAELRVKQLKAELSAR